MGASARFVISSATASLRGSRLWLTRLFASRIVVPGQRHSMLENGAWLLHTELCSTSTWQPFSIAIPVSNPNWLPNSAPSSALTKLFRITPPQWPKGGGAPSHGASS